jgi:ferric-dicitrate binding protein FerR (iron transport regulator)
MHSLKSLIALGLLAASLGTAAGKPYCTITRMEHGIQMSVAKTLKWLPCKLGHLLGHGDRVRTSPKGRAEISYMDGTIARLGPASLIHLDPHQAAGSRMGWGRFLSGSVWLKIAKGRQADIVTPAAVASVVGTEFVLDVSEKQATKIVVLEGGVDFTGTLGDTIRVKGGFWGEAIPGKKLNPPQPITPEAAQFARGLAAPVGAGVH